MIVRIWHGWTRPEDADAYGRFLRVLLSDLPASVSGSLGGWVLRRPGDGEEEFVVMTLFESLDAIRAFAGENYETPVIEPEAARLLVRWDEKAAHYEAVVQPSSRHGERCPLSRRSLVLETTIQRRRRK